MVHVDLVCTAIRLAPLWLCVAMHQGDTNLGEHARWISRVMEYGFSVRTFKQKPIVLLTHLFVHASDTHLLNNMLALFASLAEFGGSSLSESLALRSILTTLSCTVGSFVVFLVGGIAGGLGGQLLFNDVQLKRRHNQISFLPFAAQEKKMWAGRLWEALATPAQNWLDRLRYRIDKRRSDSVFMCGASAGICSLAGFNAAYYDRWANATAIALPELFCFLCWFVGSETSATRVAWLKSGEVVGHAAHLGGLVAGLAMGAAWRWASACAARWSRGRRRENTTGRRSGGRWQGEHSFE